MRSRQSRRLLRIVGNKPHATEADHEPDAVPRTKRKRLSPPSEVDNDDINADPISSSSDHEDSETAVPSLEAAIETQKGSQRRDLRLEQPSEASTRYPKADISNKAKQSKRVTSVKDKVKANEDAFDLFLIPTGRVSKTYLSSKQTGAPRNPLKTFGSSSLPKSKESLRIPAQGNPVLFKHPAVANQNNTDRANGSRSENSVIRQAPELRRSSKLHGATKIKPALDDVIKIPDILSIPATQDVKEKLGTRAEQSVSGDSNLNDEFRMPVKLSTNATLADDASISEAETYKMMLEDIGITTESNDFAADNVSLDLSDDNDVDDEDYSEKTSVIACPICGKVVPQSLLKTYREDKTKSLGPSLKLGVHEQTGFCRYHQRNVAKATWSEMGYPEIDWADIETRVCKITKSDQLRNVALGKDGSVFLQDLEEKLLSGKHRNLAQSLSTSGVAAIASLTPGYYGTRGARLFSQIATKDCSELIRARLRSDEIVGAVGVAGFIQAVLVPDIATELIMVDMQVDRSQAIRLVQESAPIGQLIWGDDDELG